MSKKCSIGFLIGIAVIVIALIVSFRIENDQIPSKEMELEEGYFIKDNEGYITVYQKNGSIYEQTSILTSELPRTIQEGLGQGIVLDNLSEVYGFLENYSS